MAEHDYDPLGRANASVERALHLAGVIHGIVGRSGGALSLSDALAAAAVTDAERDRCIRVLVGFRNEAYADARLNSRAGNVALTAQCLHVSARLQGAIDAISKEAGK